jgi:LPS-assembly lipoprotein
VPSRRLAIVWLAAGLGGCGFRPLLKQPAATDADQSVQTELAAIEVEPARGQLGQQLRNDLLDQLNPGSLQVPSRYRLTVQNLVTTNALAIQLDATITRFNLRLQSRFQLRDKQSGQLVYASTVGRTASYNVVRQPYAVLVAEEDAQRRAAREVSADIRNLLAVHFAEGNETEPTLEAEPETGRGAEIERDFEKELGEDFGPGT